MSTPGILPIDTVGAGDSFVGCLASNLARKVSLKESVQRAIFCSGISVTRKGAQKSYASAVEIPQELQLPPRLDVSERLSLSSLLLLD
jgi:ribokinase